GPDRALLTKSRSFVDSGQGCSHDRDRYVAGAHIGRTDCRLSPGCPAGIRDTALPLGATAPNWLSKPNSTKSPWSSTGAVDAAPSASAAAGTIGAAAGGTSNSLECGSGSADNTPEHTTAPPPTGRRGANRPPARLRSATPPPERISFMPRRLVASDLLATSMPKAGLTVRSRPPAPPA